MMKDLNSKQIPFLPTIDDSSLNAFLPDTPAQLIKSEHFHNVPIMTGTTSAEGLVIYLIGQFDARILSQINEDIEILLPSHFTLKRGSKKSLEVAAKIKAFYFKERNISEATLKEYVDVSQPNLTRSDSTTIHTGDSRHHNIHAQLNRGSYLIAGRVVVLPPPLLPSGREAVTSSLRASFCRIADKTSMDYFSTFKRRPLVLEIILEYSPPPPCLKSDCMFCYGAHEMVKAHLQQNHGAAHGDELFYLFRSDNVKNDIKPGTPEEKVSSNMVKLWTNFAKTGNPSVGLETVWPPYTSNDPCFLNIDTELTLGSEFNKERIEFWEKLYSEMEN
uniref:Carboxylesterase type B domain-containing protein n=1 Tax=Timema shepardi TaxID=629360 RepID=A0A7R9APE5_TIMSH|nr:unnamed protein product [Timema shepardi]